LWANSISLGRPTICTYEPETKSGGDDRAGVARARRQPRDAGHRAIRWRVTGRLPTRAPGCTERWSHGPVEGQVNRLKTITRQMYGRVMRPAPRQRFAQRGALHLQQIGLPQSSTESPPRIFSAGPLPARLVRANDHERQHRDRRGDHREALADYAGYHRDGRPDDPRSAGKHQPVSLAVRPEVPVHSPPCTTTQGLSANIRRWGNWA
jgi:hypothetical protein